MSFETLVCGWIHELSMKQHVIKVAGACFHQLRHLRQIRRCVGREVGPDAGNIQTGLLQFSSRRTTIIYILQRVQNAAARLICQLKPREHVTPSFQQLHWLPVKQRVQSKLCTIMYAVHAHQGLFFLHHKVRFAVSVTVCQSQSQFTNDSC